MPIVNVEPAKDYPVPYDTTEQKTDNLLDEMAVASNTIELQLALGAQLDISEGDLEREKDLLRAVTEARKPASLKEPNTAFAAAAFLRTYGAQLALDAAQARAAITNKLMEIANCGDPRFELRALELLGKHSDIGIFTERSELTLTIKMRVLWSRRSRIGLKGCLTPPLCTRYPWWMHWMTSLGLPDARISLEIR